LKSFETKERRHLPVHGQAAQKGTLYRGLQQQSNSPLQCLSDRRVRSKAH